MQLQKLKVRQVVMKEFGIRAKEFIGRVWAQGKVEMDPKALEQLAGKQSAR
jgi:hypothetical protein